MLHYNPRLVGIGSITLDAPFFLAGLAGYSDAAMRLVARRHGCPYCITEAMLDQFLIAGGRGLAAAELDEADHPIAGQLMGSHPDDIAKGCKILVGLGYDVIDINLACPVKKIKKKSRGGHLLSVPDEAIAILDAARQAVPSHVPCTVKLRRGSDDSVEAERNFHRIFEKVIELGYAAAVIHGRTVEQKYVGPSRWRFLRDLMATYGGAQGTQARRHEGTEEDRSTTQAPEGPKPRMEMRGPRPIQSEAPTQDTRFVTRDTKQFIIGGSGDIWCAADIFRMIDETGVAFVSVARGCIGNPWIFEQARAMMRGDAEAAHRPPTITQQRRVLLEHFELSIALHGERAAGMMMRKFGIRFSRHHPERDVIRKRFIEVKSLADWHAVLKDHYTHDGPGVAVTDALPEEAGKVADCRLPIAN